MRCPYCATENRDDREKCYHCGKDLSMLRLIVNRARNHYNTALEHAERGRLYEAIGELRSALQLDSHLVDARLLLGTIYARLGRTEDARKEWQRVLAEQPNSRRAHEYIQDLPALESRLPLLRRLRLLLAGFATIVGVLLLFSFVVAWPSRQERALDQAWVSFADRDLAASVESLARISRPMSSDRLEARAASLEESIERIVADRLALIQDLSARGDVRGALSQIRFMRLWELPAAPAEALRQQERLLRRVVETELDEIASMDFTPDAEQMLRERLEEARLFFPDADLGHGVLDRFRTRGRTQLYELLAEIDDRLLDGDAGEATRLMIDRAERLGNALGITAPVAVRVEVWRSTALELAVARARDLAAEQRIEEALAVLDAAPDQGPVELIAERRIVRESIGQSWAAEQYARWRDDPARFDQHEMAAWLPYLGDAERARLEAELERRREREAARRTYEMLALVREVQERGLERPQARSLLGNIAELRSMGLPARLRVRADEALLFLQAHAHGTLGETDEMERALDELRTRHPRSPLADLVRETFE